MASMSIRFAARGSAAVLAALVVLCSLHGPYALAAAGDAPPAEKPAGEALCPACKAPLEPGALFCSNCGRKIEAPVAAPAAKTRTDAAVVQVVAAYDSEITSTFGSMVYESNLRIDSILGSAFAV